MIKAPRPELTEMITRDFTASENTPLFTEELFDKYGVEPDLDVLLRETKKHIRNRELGYLVILKVLFDPYVFYPYNWKWPYENQESEVFAIVREVTRLILDLFPFERPLEHNKETSHLLYILEWLTDAICKTIDEINDPAVLCECLYICNRVISLSVEEDVEKNKTIHIFHAIEYSYWLILKSKLRNIGGLELFLQKWAHPNIGHYEDNKELYDELMQELSKEQ